MSTPEPNDRYLLLIRLLKLGSFINGPMKDGVCDPCGVTPIETKVLMALAGEGDLAGHDLVEIMGIPAMNVSRALAALRDRGWIEDSFDPENRRRRPVRLSDKGRAQYEQMTPAIDALAMDLLGSLTDRQKRDLAVLSDKVIASMAAWITGHHSSVKLKN